MTAHLFLVGFMGSGKSSVGRALAERTGRPFVDLDARIEEQEGRPISQIFEQDGEACFRETESRVLARLATEPDSVVACGGGVVLDPENRVRLRDTGRVVHLKVSAEEAADRVGDSGARPLFRGGAEGAEELLASRRGAYDAVAEFTVDTDGISVDGVVDEIVRLMEES